jgi:DNA-binding NarL/FixJ family response regulator
VGYLLKSMPPEDILAGVRPAARGQTTLAPALVRRLLSDHVSGRLQADPRLQRLNARETEVLRHVAAGRSNAEIASALFVGEGTVKTHVAGILHKLGLRDRVQAAVAAYELGLVRPRQKRSRQVGHGEVGADGLDPGIGDEQVDDVAAAAPARP